MSRIPRWAHILLGLLGAIVLLVVLSVPVIFRGGGGTLCQRTLRYAGRDFVPREANAVQALAIGTGVVSGCGAAPENVEIRSVAGISPALAVELPTQSGTIYVAKGRCPGLKDGPLLRCLRRS